MPDWEFDFDRMVVYKLEDAYPTQSYNEEERVEWAKKQIEEQNVYLLLRRGQTNSSATFKDFKAVGEAYQKIYNKQLTDHAEGMNLVKDMVQSKFDFNE